MMAGLFRSSCLKSSLSIAGDVTLVFCEDERSNSTKLS